MKVNVRENMDNDDEMQGREKTIRGQNQRRHKFGGQITDIAHTIANHPCITKIPVKNKRMTEK